jgi:hypothetical protein
VLTAETAAGEASYRCWPTFTPAHAQGSKAQSRIRCRFVDGRHAHALIGELFKRSMSKRSNDSSRDGAYFKNGGSTRGWSCKQPSHATDTPQLTAARQRELQPSDHRCDATTSALPPAHAERSPADRRRCPLPIAMHSSAFYT